MAAPKQRLFFCITLILFLCPSSEPLLDHEPEYSAESSLKIKHEQLLAKILNLESSIGKSSHEIDSKDERIKILETTVVEKASSLASLNGEILFLQKKESFEAKEMNEQVGEADVQAGELEKQVENLKKEIEKQNTEKKLLEARINNAEINIEELTAKLEKLKEINEEQNSRIHNTELALLKAEEERSRIRFNAARYSKKLAEVHESWLPHWLAVHLVHYQSLIVTHWNVYGRPALNLAKQKALETEAQLRKWAWPHIDAIHTKWVPIIKEQWVTFVTNTEPHMQRLAAKTVEVYHESKETLRPHITNIQIIVDPYIKEYKKLMKPYVDRLKKSLKPYIRKYHKLMRPYTLKLIRGYKKAKKGVLNHHWRVRANVVEKLMQYEFTRPLASNDLLVWFTAMAFMVFPVIVVVTMVSSLFSKRPRRRTRKNRSTRRGKRVHQDRETVSR